MQRGYPLGALFLLMAVCGGLLSLAAPGMPSLMEEAGDTKFIATFVVSFLSLAATGGIIGLHHHRRWLGLLTGSTLGVVLGVWVPFMFAVPQEAWKLQGISGLAAIVCVLAIGGFSLAARRN